jgi:hypothetical protein
MKLSNISLSAFFILAQLTASGQSLESVYTKGDRLVYQECEITRSAEQGEPLAALTRRSSAEVDFFSKHFKSVSHIKMDGQASSGGLVRPPAVTGSAGKMVKGWKDCEKHNPSE